MLIDTETLARFERTVTNAEMTARRIGDGLDRLFIVACVHVVLVLILGIAVGVTIVAARP